ncbi:unnamed protein product [Brachionus calyciflorus]|uniref:Uncharacterized protein n=1 Tax=Brachionus calyciflorus TaxID=104777 RepID=A0A813RW67_9BILA|nr:unnamed protein product [Brachionus calyciflorus]
MDMYDKTYNSPEEKAELFGTLLAEIFTENIEPNFDSTHKKIIDDFIEEKGSNLFVTNPTDKDLDEDISIEELDEALKSINRKSSPGPDKITNKHLSNLGIHSKHLILKIINLSWKEGIILDDWKIAKITMLEKDVSDKNNPFLL